ncbi:MAG: quinone-dependent dihydroorotate dehydrogenase [bacterium]|nr:quinone-dependent dihydroorotate dehydrogenase [bacterium]
MSNKLAITIASKGYKNILKPLLFKINPEIVHERMTGFGEFLGRSAIMKMLCDSLLTEKYPILQQNIDGIDFKTPVGLSAGFDYDARLTQILPHIGFGFQSVGTISRSPYSGNPGHILGRLPKSRSLMVNKGFKNKGVQKISESLTGKHFDIPVGISIGRTNSTQLKTHDECIADILGSFIICENSQVNHSYYELNISCPNLLTPVSFYDPTALNKLLRQLEILSIQKSLFIKMPIECDDRTIISLLSVISDHKVKGVIFGNLQKDRRDPSLVPSEVSKFKSGNFSGKPTEQRSNELIQLAHKSFGNRFTIIGVGGIFSAEDAYKKIKLGANLVQLITGMIFEGPQLIAEINEGINKLLIADGYTHISQAVGTESR